MKKLIAGFAFTSALAISAFGADFKGFVMDEKCSANPKMRGNEACAQRCIGGGATAVLVDADGKVYKIAEQDKVKSVAGKNVTITGKLDGDKISVESVKAD